MFGFRKLLRQITERLEKIEASLEAWYQAGAHSTDELRTDLKELRSAANRHDMAIEDLLDSWEEMQRKQEKEKETLSDALTQAMERERRQTAQREYSLLQLCMTAMDQISALKRAADESGSEEWSLQLKFAEDKLRSASLPAGFQIIGNAGVPVDYGIHEVIDVYDAGTTEQENTVAEVLSCGYAYMGKIFRKAKVSAFRKPVSESEYDNSLKQEEI